MTVPNRKYYGDFTKFPTVWRGVIVDEDGRMVVLGPYVVRGLAVLAMDKERKWLAAAGREVKRSYLQHVVQWAKEAEGDEEEETDDEGAEVAPVV